MVRVIAIALYPYQYVLLRISYPQLYLVLRSAFRFLSTPRDTKTPRRVLSFEQNKDLSELSEADRGVIEK